MEIVATHRPVHPSPLSQIIGKKEDSDFSNRRHSQHPTFQQILDEVSLEKQGQNSVLNFHEFKDPGNPAPDRNSRKNHASDSKEPSLAMSGAILTSSDIILSTLMDGPYQQTQSKAAKLLSSPKHSKNSQTNSLDPQRRSNNQQNYLSSRERSIRSSSQSDYGISPSRIITRPSSPQISTQSLFNEGRYGYRQYSNSNQASHHSGSISSSFTQTRSEPSSPQLRGRSRPSSPHLSPVNSHSSRPGSPQSKSNKGHSSRPGSPQTGRDSRSYNSSHSYSSRSHSPSLSHASHIQHSSSNSRSSRSSQHSAHSHSSKNIISTKSHSTPTSPQLLPSSSRINQTYPSNKLPHSSTRKIISSNSSYSHESLIQSTSNQNRNIYDKDSRSTKSTQSYNKNKARPSISPESFEATRSSSTPTNLPTNGFNDKVSQRRGSHSTVMDVYSSQKSNGPRFQQSSHRSTKSLVSTPTLKKPQDSFDISLNSTPTLKDFESKPAVDWSFIENVDAKLAYNHFTKEARLVYFEDGYYPKKKLLPKGRLIPPSQLTFDRETEDKVNRYLSPVPMTKKSNSDPINMTSPTRPPPLPRKSPARKLSRVLSPKAESLSDDSFSQGLKGLLESSFWSKDSTLSETNKTPISLSATEESISASRLNKTRSINDLLSKAGGTKIANLSQCDASQPSSLSIDSIDDDVNEKAWALSADPKSLPGALRRRPSSAFDKRVRVAPEPTVVPNANIYSRKPQHWLSQFRQQEDNGAMFVTGKTSCAILCGSLYKLGGNRQWQKRQFRADGFLLVCLSKERIKNQSDTIYMEQPDYLTEDWRSYCHPTTPPTPHITHPLVASPSTDNPKRLDYYQAPKWVIPIGDIVEVSLLTRKGVRVPDSFVIHTRSRNYILKAINPHELASWIYMLQRMIITYQDCRALMPGFTPDTLSRSTSVDESFQLSTKDLGLRFKPVSTHPRSRERDQNRLSSRDKSSKSDSQKASSQAKQDSSAGQPQRTDSTRLLQQQGRRASSLFHTHRPGSLPDTAMLSEHQLNREIAHDWIGGLASLSYCKRTT